MNFAEFLLKSFLSVSEPNANPDRLIYSGQNLTLQFDAPYCIVNIYCYIDTDNILSISSIYTVFQCSQDTCRFPMLTRVKRENEKNTF